MLQKYGKIVMLFALCTAYYLGAELVVNDLALPVLGAAHISALYGAGACFAALGFPCYYLVVRFGGSVARKKIITRLLFLSCIASVAGIYYVTQPFVFVAMALLLTFSSGYIMAIVIRIAAAFLEGSRHTGRMVGVAYALAFVLQSAALAFGSLLNSLLALRLEMLLLEALLLLFFYVLLFRYPTSLLYNTWPTPAQAGAGKSRAAGWRYIAGLLACVALVCLLTGLNDGIITELHAKQQVVVYDFVRLCSVPGLLLAGWAADLPSPKALPFATFAAMVGMALAILLYSSPEGYNLAMALVYFFGAFMSIYCIVPFMRAAPGSAAPTLVASLGRSTKYLFTGVAAFLGSQLFGRVSFAALEGLYLVLLIALFGVIFLLQPTGAPAPQEKSPEPPTDDFRAFYGLTARENEVLQLVLQGKNTRDMAEILFITERTVKFHMSGILQKTKTANRVELLLTLRK